jgi:sodium-independent sulfate anion transporter 11
MVLGTTKEITIGPTAILSLLSAPLVEAHGPAFLSTVCMLTGIVTLVMGMFKLGFVVNFISTPVTAGFASTTAVVIAVSQLASLLGLKNVKGDKVTDTLQSIFSQIEKTNFYDAGMGIIACICLIIMRVSLDKIIN